MGDWHDRHHAFLHEHLGPEPEEDRRQPPRERHRRRHRRFRERLQASRLVHWRLRRRIFLWFGVAVGVSAGLAWFLVERGVSTTWACLSMAIVLWAASGAIAWRLTMPLVELAKVARALGDGDLDARMRPGHHARELSLIAASINDMAARIGSQLRDQRELLAAVSHEIRTPLGHMRVLLDTARDRAAGASAADLHELEREVLEIDALVDQLLASSRLDFGTLERRPLDVAVEAARALERLGVDGSRLEVHDDACTIAADPTLLRSALANLVRNAIEHGGGVAQIAVGKRAGSVEIVVDDAGPGFADDDLARVFMPFFRGTGVTPGDKPARGSLGLGLSLVERIARAHGGSVRAENRAGGGARVTLAFAALSATGPA